MLFFYLLITFHIFSDLDSHGRKPAFRKAFILPRGFILARRNRFYRPLFQSKKPPPYTLTRGIYTYSYKAVDRQHNLATCVIYVLVYGKHQCLPYCFLRT